MSVPYPCSQLFAHHPTVSPKVVIIRFDGGRVDALDARNGITLWTADIGYVKVRRRSKFDSVGGLLIVGDMVCIGSTDRGLYALDISSGDTIWRYNARTPVVGTPYHAHGTVYALAWNGGHAVDIRTGEKCWHWKSEKLVWFGFPARGCVYGAEAGREIVALEAQSGEKVWGVNCHPNYYHPAFDGNVLYFGTMHKEVVKLDIHSQKLSVLLFPKEQSENEQRGWNFTATSQPVVAEDQLYVLADDRHLYTCDLNDGSIRWRKACSVPSVLSGVVYTPSHDEEGLLVLDSLTGRKIGFIMTDESLLFPPAIWKGIAFVAGWNTLTALDLDRRRVLWFRRYPEEPELQLFDVG